jgi:hypothetical protein
MLKKIAILLPLCAASLSASAEKGASIMFDPPERTITGTPPLEVKTTGDKCQELQQLIDSLEGKPQRRHAAMERYKLECSAPAQ